MTRSFGWLTGGPAIVGLLVAASVHGSQISPVVAETAFLTVNVPIALPGVALAPGTYIFELADPSGRVDLVRVSSQDRSRVYFTGFTERIERPAGQRADRPLTLGESPAGAPRPILAWYPSHESTGHQFVFPSQSRQLLEAANR
jgi:hypothetical protein